MADLSNGMTSGLIRTVYRESYLLPILHGLIQEKARQSGICQRCRFSQINHLNVVSRIDTLYTMIKTFKHKGIEKFFASGSKAEIQPKHANKLSEQLARLNSAVGAEDMNLPGWAWHPLSKDLEGHWAVSVNGNWRLTFSFEGKDAILVDYQDYH
jgi:toxin HigB-1